MSQNWLKISERICIPVSELTFVFSRSSGPGGQNVNKVNTKVTLYFNVNVSTILTDEEKEKILTNLHTRVNKLGILRIISSRHRTQGANKKAAINRFFTLLSDLFLETLKRKRTNLPKAAKEKRLQDKKHHSKIKRSRQGKFPFDD